MNTQDIYTTMINAVQVGALALAAVVLVRLWAETKGDA